MKIKLFADGANIDDIKSLYSEGNVRGFTTNPTLMKKAGIKNYLDFALEVLEVVKDLPVSFEVFSDDFDEMYTQAQTLAALGDNIYIKIPVTNTKGESSASLIRKLDAENIKLNVTAVFTISQVEEILSNMSGNNSHIISVFAGRIADTGLDPANIMKEALGKIKAHSSLLELLWASPREVLNIYQAEEVGCDIITATPDILKKMSLRDKSLEEFSRETVIMFYKDAHSSGYTL